MSLYEITILTQTEEAALKVAASLGKVSTIKQQNSIGERELSYLINKHKVGYYLDLFCDINSAEIVNIDKNLKNDASILRYLIVKRKDLPKKIEERVEPKSKASASTEKTNFKPVVKPKTVTKQLSTEDVKHRQETLDKSLDEILKS